MYLPFIIKINLIPFCKSYSHFACPIFIFLLCFFFFCSFPLHRPLLVLRARKTSHHSTLKFPEEEQFPVFLILKLVLKQLLYSDWWLLYPHPMATTTTSCPITNLLGNRCFAKEARRKTLTLPPVKTLRKFILGQYTYNTSSPSSTSCSACSSTD